MTASPEISIVIVAWEAREHVLACLRSIQTNVRLDAETIVVDDGSGDGTADAVRAEFPAATVIAKLENTGLVDGRNAALPHVRGEKVLMLDADTEVRPGAVETLARALDEHASVGLVGPRLIGPDGELQLSTRRFPPLVLPPRGPLARWRAQHTRVQQRHLMMDFDHASRRPVVWVSGAAQMWRAALPGLIGGYDPMVSSYGGEDLDWCLRVWAADLEVLYVPDAVVTHHWQDVVGRSPVSRQARRALRDWYYLQWKHRRLRRDPRLREAKA